MEFKGSKIEFDLEELAPLLIADKQEGFRRIGEQMLNAIIERDWLAGKLKSLDLSTKKAMVDSEGVQATTNAKNP
ncbi:MAG: hypothetical protein JHC35_08380 [Sulfuricurvum sp.]|uniref:hypothetical protein n=1 Tax=Sulfuricurvum sp. TaxID=2025608 RepID=UPI0025F02C26|nr:hypothetical protein [Sulfuricurvum sp.]MCI4407279.1 hypothetical protein [Sulfuricurvum sp.]